MYSVSATCKHSFAYFALFFSLLISPAFVFAYDPDNNTRHGVGDSASVAEVMKNMKENGGHGEEKFNAGTTITEHISDSHEWHLWGHTSIPLPVILYTDKGFECFMSSKVSHGHTHKGSHYSYKIEHNHIIAIDEATGEANHEAKIYDFSITKNVVTIFIVCGLMLWIFISVAKAYTRNPGQAPRGLQSFVEPLIIFIRDDVAKASIGEKKYAKFMPYLLTIFFFILISNLLGLVPVFPGGANMTGNIGVTMSLALLTFIITTVNGNAHYWRHIFAMPGVPAGILFILTPIEIMGVFLRPFVLMIRLFANITAGHIIALSFFCMIFIFSEMSTGLGYGVGIFASLFVIFMTALELLVAFLQAYVFTLLSAIYFGSATEEHHHEEHDHKHAAAH
ncbi:MAG: F-type H+-transporting ATPase subunit a [Bacteroidetes bacterium]|nr:MAG: F-type H+-transporting ATPase subunit a [Bacteroidota bacterium]